jgi:hypothetical protein
MASAYAYGLWRSRSKSNLVLLTHFNAKVSSTPKISVKFAGY